MKWIELYDKIYQESLKDFKMDVKRLLHILPTFFGLTQPFNGFYVFYNNVRERKLLRMQMILNHWNVNELYTVELVFSFSVVDKPGFCFALFFS